LAEAPSMAMLLANANPNLIVMADLSGVESPVEGD
jgi:hypothetical protein